MAYYFNCCKWFAVERDDGKVERDITPVESGIGFTQVQAQHVYQVMNVKYVLAFWCQTLCYTHVRVPW